MAISLFLWDMRTAAKGKMAVGADDLALSSRVVDWMSSLMSSGRDVAVMVVGTHARSAGSDLAEMGRLFETTLIQAVTAQKGAVVVNGHELQYLSADGEGQITCQLCFQAGDDFMAKACSQPPSTTENPRVHVFGYFGAESTERAAWRLPGGGYTGPVEPMGQEAFALEVASVGYSWLRRNAPGEGRPGCLLKSYVPVMQLCEVCFFVWVSWSCFGFVW